MKWNLAIVEFLSAKDDFMIFKMKHRSLASLSDCELTACFNKANKMVSLL